MKSRRGEDIPTAIRRQSMATATHAAVRGSEEMSEEMFGRPSEVSKAALKQLLNVTRAKEVSLLGWWTHGKPAIDIINGVIHAKPNVAGKIIQDLLTIDKLPLKVEGFPLGTINPELIEIRFSTPGGR
jgi:hypothetical protein